MPDELVRYRAKKLLQRLNMSKIFISTMNCGKAHQADIFDVAICAPFTVSCSGDGTIKLWKNKLLDGENPKDHVVEQFVHCTGVHHVDVIHTIEAGGFEVCLVACVSFSGDLFIYQVDVKTLQLTQIDLLDIKTKKRSFWAVSWFKSSEPEQGSHRLAATDVKGETYIWNLHTIDKTDENTPKLHLNLELQGTIEVGDSVFATCVDISSSGLIATGFANGRIVVSQLSTMRPIYNFEGFGIQGTAQNSNTVRCIKFSPLGSLLAVANDSGSYGCVTLYETKYGERVGNLTVPTHSTQSGIGSYAHNGWVFGLSFNSSGEFLATCGYDSKVRVWDVKERERLSTLNMSANDIEIEEDILLEDETGDSLLNPPVMAVTYIGTGVRAGMGTDSNEGLCCVCMDRSVRWFREAGGK